MKKRIPASDRQRKELIQLLGGGVSAEENVLSSVIRKGAEIILQELLEEEVSEYLGRGHYERSEGKEEIKKGYRNGYKPRTIKSGEGKLQVELPQLRDTEEPYSSKLATFFEATPKSSKAWRLRCMLVGFLPGTSRTP